MTCRDIRRMADSLPSAQMTADAEVDILRHLDFCPSCRIEVDGRRRIRTALRGALAGARDLQPQADFSARLRHHLREQAERDRRRARARRSWVGLAAGLLLVAGLTARFVFDRANATSDALAADAIADHRNCALKLGMDRMPVPLTEAAERFDKAYRLLITAPADGIAASGGPVRVVDRHACAYDGRRFGHVIMQYRGHVVSLLMTAGGAAAGAAPGGGIPHVIGHSTNGLSVVTVNASDRSILLVADLGSAELTELSTIIAKPLAQRLAGARPAMTTPAFVAAFQWSLPLRTCTGLLTVRD